MKSACVLGSSGTIGHQLIKYLKKEGYWVRGVDIVHPQYSKTQADQFIQLDLRNPSQCAVALFPPARQLFDIIFMLAAQMGGADFIFTKQNDAEIIYDNAMMNLNVAKTASDMRAGGKLFFASSACMYSEDLQKELNSPALKEDTAWHGKPDSVYGIEKLFSETVYDSFYRNKNLNIRIGRFHNIFSPECHYKDNRAKSPAAICYKVAKAKDGDEIEIFGDGQQQRSFLFINEAIEAVMRLMESNYSSPLNIGSEEMISINDFAKMIIEISGKNLIIKNIPSDATGVRGRNSDNLKIHEVLGWEPSQPLRIGIEKLYHWVNAQVNRNSDVWQLRIPEYIPLTEKEKSELKEGDVVFIQTSWSMVKGKYPEVLNQDTHVNLFGGDTIESKTKLADLYKINNG